MHSSYKPLIVQPHQSDPARSTTEVPPSLSDPGSWSNGQGVINFPSINPTTPNDANYGPPAPYMTGLPPLVMGLMEGNQNYSVSTSEISQIAAPLVLVPESELGYHAPLVGPPQATPNTGLLSAPPHHPSNVGPSHGSFGMPPNADDLKHLAYHYLSSPRSHIEKLRVRQRRTGGSKVLIVLEIDDIM